MEAFWGAEFLAKEKASACSPGRQADNHIISLSTFQAEVWGQRFLHGYHGSVLGRQERPEKAPPLCGGHPAHQDVRVPFSETSKASITCSLVLVFLKSRFTEPSSF